MGCYGVLQKETNNELMGLGSRQLKNVSPIALNSPNLNEYASVSIKLFDTEISVEKTDTSWVLYINVKSITTHFVD